MTSWREIKSGVNQILDRYQIGTRDRIRVMGEISLWEKMEIIHGVTGLTQFVDSALAGVQMGVIAHNLSSDPLITIGAGVGTVAVNESLKRLKNVPPKITAARVAVISGLNGSLLMRPDSDSSILLNGLRLILSGVAMVGISELSRVARTGIEKRVRGKIAILREEMGENERY